MSNEKGLNVYTSRPWESIKTCFLVLTWIILGLHLELVGPTLKILAEQTGVDLTNISTILATRNGGYMIANLVGAVIQNTVQKYPEGFLGLSFLIASIVVVVTPFIRSLTVLSIVFFFQGISQGTTDLGGTSSMLIMWGDKVAAPLNIVHLGFGFGAMFSNLLVKPFLGEKQIIEITSNNQTRFIENKPTNIQIPYLITSFLCLIISIIHVILSIREYRNRNESQKKKNNQSTNYSSVSQTIEEKKVKKYSEYSPRVWGNGNLSYGLTLSIIWIFYMFFLGGNDQTFGKFFFEFLKTPQFAISSSGATWGMVTYWLSYSIGRLICAVITMFIPVHYAISGLWVCGFLLAIMWFIFVWIIELNRVNLFILGGLTGLVFSPTFPLSFAFINPRLNVNPFLVALFLSGSACGGMVFQKIGGFVLDHNRKHFPTLLIICVLSAIILFILGLILSEIHRKKLDSKKKLNTIEDQPNISEEEQQMKNYLHENQ